MTGKKSDEQRQARGDKTLQDDRNVLDLEPGDNSPLVTGEGAPLAEDEVVEPQPEPPTEMPIMLGGAAVPVELATDAGMYDDARHSMTAAKDRPIND